MRILGSVTAVVLLLLAQGCSTTPQELQDYMDPLVLKKIVENVNEAEMIHVIDVRTREEHAAGHIPGTENIPVDTIGAAPPTEDTSAVIIVYCRSGARSGRAQGILKEMGYQNVYNFGGISRWNWELETGTGAETVE